MRVRAIGLAVPLVVVSLVASITAEAQQQAKVSRLGLLGIFSREGSVENLAAVRQGLRERGWVEGQNLLIEERWAEGDLERLAGLAADLVRVKVDVIFAGNDSLARAAKNATTTIPIVIITRDDPVRAGLVASLARPGRNITGLSMTADVGIVGKQLQFLTEVVPTLSRVALLTDPADPPRHLLWARQRGLPSR